MLHELLSNCANNNNIDVLCHCNGNNSQFSTTDLPFPVLIGSFTVEGDIDEAYLAFKDPCPGLGFGLELLGKSPKSCNWLMWVYDF